MKYSKILIAILLLILSCKDNTEKNSLSVSSAQSETTQEQIDFFDKKYFTGYNLAIDESNISEHPFFSYLDCKNEGYFSVHFVPKAESDREFWKKEYYKTTDFNTYDFGNDSKRIEVLLNKNLTNYNVFSYFVGNKYLNNKNGCTIESVYLDKNSIAEIYLYNHQIKKWEIVKSEKSDMLPPYRDNNYFLKLFPELFSFDKVVKLNDKKNVDEVENLTLFKNFSFKFLTSKIKSGDEDEKQRIKITIKNNETNKIQEIDFIPQYLVTKFDGSPSNSTSYFDTKKLVIKSYQEIEGGHMLIALDVNFDGLEDFAIINYQGSNGGPQYAYYKQNSQKEFELDIDLTDNVRFFPIEINNKEKTLTFGHPSGCCKINTFKIQIQPNGEWNEIYSKLEDVN